MGSPGPTPGTLLPPPTLACRSVPFMVKLCWGVSCRLLPPDILLDVELCLSGSYGWTVPAVGSWGKGAVLVPPLNWFPELVIPHPPPAHL